MDKEPDVIPKKKVPAYKYSAKGTSTLHEAIILQGQPVVLIQILFNKGIK